MILPGRSGFISNGFIGTNGIPGIIGAMIVGILYASKFKEPIPDRLRFYVMGMYMGIEYAIAYVYWSNLIPSYVTIGMPSYANFIIIPITFSFFYSLAIYIILAEAGKYYLKKKGFT